MSADFWERMLYGPAWFVLFLFVFFLIKGAGPVFAVCFLLMMTGILTLTDRWSRSGLRLAVVHCGNGGLVIAGRPVAVDDVIWIREIWYQQVTWTIIEIAHMKDGQEVRALCAGKPGSPLSDRNKTIRLIIQRFPVLDQKVTWPYLTARKRRVLRTPRPELEHEMEPVVRNINPMARYRDPYFRRKGR